MIELSI